MLKGAIHVHSRYSDGEFTLPELRQMFRAAGCSFVCMTDHAESFNPATLQEYVCQCEELSEADFCFIPGLEYGCADKMHILGYGETSLLHTKQPQEIIQNIEREGGVSVIAHPKDEAFPYIETFDVLPSGIEGWNTKYDGRYAPRPGTFRLIDRLRQRKPGLCTFYGQDLHYEKQFHGLYTNVFAKAANRSSILAALGSGEFMGRIGDLELPANASLPVPLLARFARVHKRYDLMRKTLRSVKATAKRLGLKIPAPMTAQFRKIISGFK
jgi:hypothetical protein